MPQPLLLTANLDEMVFEGRDTRYGAYALRKSYPMRLALALFATCLTSLAFTFGPILAKQWLGVSDSDVHAHEPLEMTRVEVTLPVDEPEFTPPTLELPKPVQALAFLIPDPVREEDLADQSSTIRDIQTLQEAKNLGLTDVDGEDRFAEFPTFWDQAGDIPAVVQETAYESDETFKIVDEEPLPLNLDDLKTLIGYPRLALEAQIEGLVVVRVLVDNKGNDVKHKVLKTSHPLLSKPVEERLHQLRFTPAIQGGRPVSFWVNVPFKFSLVQ